MSLEEKVEDKESRGFMKKALRLGWKAGMAAATTALSMATVGTSGALVGAGFAAGGMLANLFRGKSLYDAIDGALTTYSAVNAALYPMVLLGDATFPLIDNSTLGGKLLRGLYASTAYNAAFIGAFKGAGHLVDNYLNPTGIMKTVKTDFVKDWISIGAMFSPFYYMAANNISHIGYSNPSIGNIVSPTFAVGAPPVGFAHNYWFGKDKKKAH